ncbi:DUF5605 domain-containing protein [Paenibacillus sp. FSL H8-0537]|uniref:DUF5605 domain-containing protein n=1 Tax=Paenibacillus sp. FSL H8-0537 TaxID=2921399 RepID=UPI0031019913
MIFSEETKIGYIWASPEGRKVLLKHAPELADSPYLSFIKMNTLPRFATSNQALMRSPEWVAEVLGELSGIEYVIEDETEQKAASALDNESNEGSAAQLSAGVTLEAQAEAEGSAKLLAQGEVARWDVYELELHGPAHGNPFTDAAISAVFSQGERSLSAQGFYDGDGIYRVRFMPDAEGEWHYRTSSSVGAMNGITGSFACRSAEAGNNGPVRVADTFHFAYEDGSRYLPVGTTCYAWTHQGQELEEQTLATLAQTPFNKLRMCVFPKAYLFNENEPPLYPFERSADGQWDFTRFDPAYFRHLEQRIAELGRLGIEADLILFHAYDRWGFSEMPKSADDRYLRYITARLAAYRNVWWSLANEYDLMWAKEESDWERFAQIVTDNDPYGHLISIHNCFGFYDYTRSWITHCSVQRVDVYRTAENTDQWRKDWNKPIVIDECAYEGDIDMGWGNISGEEMVRRFWEGAIRGGYVGHGETYLHPEDILWWSKGGKLHGTSPERIAFLRKVLEEGPEQGLNPLRSEWDAPSAGIADTYYLFYYGFNQPRYRNFTMKPGIAYEVEVLDTWNMTVTKQTGTYEGTFRIELPGKPYMAIQMRRANASA